MDASPHAPPALIALTPGTLQRAATGSSERAVAQLERAAAAAVAGGVRAIVVREPLLEDGAFLELALRLRAVLDDGARLAASTAPDSRATSARPWLCVHDRLHLAAAAGADAAHVGGHSLESRLAREVVGPSLALGVSTHERDEPSTWDAADYTVHGPVFAPNSKAGHGAPIGVDGLRAFTERCNLPVYAVGGMDAERARELRSMAPGHHGIAIIGGLWGTDSNPIDGRPSPLGNLEAIEAAARSLIEATDDRTPKVARSHPR